MSDSSIRRIIAVHLQTRRKTLPFLGVFDITTTSRFV